MVSSSILASAGTGWWCARTWALTFDHSAVKAGAAQMTWSATKPSTSSISGEPT